MQTPLINYSSSESESEDSHNDNKVTNDQTSPPILPRKRKMPPLPNELTMFESKLGKDSNPEEHQGRKRRIPHIGGNWAVHVFVQVVPNDTLRASLTTAYQKLQIVIPSIHPMISIVSDTSMSKLDSFFSFAATTDECSQDDTQFEENIDDKLHISLTRVGVFLKNFQIARFIELLGEKSATVKAFSISFAKMSQLFNDDKTRRFFCADTSVAFDGNLQKLLKAVDTVVQEFGLPAFYQDPQFHASFAWSLNDCTIDDGKVDKVIDDVNHDLKNSEITHEIYNVTKILCKIGNKDFQIPLG